MDQIRRSGITGSTELLSSSTRAASTSPVAIVTRDGSGSLFATDRPQPTWAPDDGETLERTAPKTDAGRRTVALPAFVLR
ncbi:MAG TPA: hypothetical protein VMU14_24995 [Acidimicrobiales bacterium]|nr:hypothetical protein [Acidimicrobiales bacterium]